MNNGPELIDQDLSADPLAANKAIVAEFFAAFSEGRLEDAATLVKPDGDSWSLTKRHTRTLAEKIAKARALHAELQNGLELEILSMTAEADRVSAVLRSNAHFHDGRVYDNYFHFLVWLHNGRIVKMAEYNDTAYSERVLRPK